MDMEAAPPLIAAAKCLALCIQVDGYLIPYNHTGLRNVVGRTWG